MNFTTETGFHETERMTVATLYWDAFCNKLGIVMGPRDKALAFISTYLNPDYALVARSGEGRILGVAGFKTSKGSLIDGNLRDLAAVYGWASTCWRAPLLAITERGLRKDVLLMDGICVSDAARGMGLGTALLTAIKAEATARDLTSVRLDVIDSNPRARALYEREGFVCIGEQHLGPFRWIFGFRVTTKMLWSAG